MTMRGLAPLLFIIPLLVTKADTQNINNSELRGRFYKLENEMNFSYENKAIMDHLEGVSREECLLVCGRTRGCQHVSFLEANQQCKLLTGVVKEFERKVDGGEKIYTFLAGKQLSKFETFYIQ